MADSARCWTLKSKPMSWLHLILSVHKSEGCWEGFWKIKWHKRFAYIFLEIPSTSFHKSEALVFSEYPAGLVGYIVQSSFTVHLSKLRFFLACLNLERGWSLQYHFNLKFQIHKYAVFNIVTLRSVKMTDNLLTYPLLQQP